jgi:predicted esterase
MTPGIRVVTVVIVLAAWWAWGPVASAETAAGAGGSPPSADSPISLTLDGRGPVKVPGSVVSAPTTPVYALRTVPQPPVLDGKLDDPTWADVGPLTPFRDPPEANRSTSVVRIARYGDDLYLGVECLHPTAASESWSHAGAPQPARDTVMRSDEGVQLDLNLTNSAGDAVCVFFHPTGAFADSRGADASWSGNIEAVTTTSAAGWCLEARVSLSSLPGWRADAPTSLFSANVSRRSRLRIGGWAQWYRLETGLFTSTKGPLAVEALSLGVLGPGPGAGPDVPLLLGLRNLTDQPRDWRVTTEMINPVGLVLCRQETTLSLPPGKALRRVSPLDCTGACVLRLTIDAGEGTEPAFLAELPMAAAPNGSDCLNCPTLTAAVRPEADVCLGDEPGPIYLLAAGVGEEAVRCQGRLTIRDQAGRAAWQCPVSVDLPAGSRDAKIVQVPAGVLAPGRWRIEWQVRDDQPGRLAISQVDLAPPGYLRQLGRTAATDYLASVGCPVPGDAMELALMQICLDRLGDAAQRPRTAKEDVETRRYWLQLTSLVEALRPGTPYLAAARGWFESVFVSPVDGSYQPIALFVPYDYDSHPDRQYPLEVWLHGHSRTHFMDNPLGSNSGFSPGGDRGVTDHIILYPMARGRGNGYVGVAGNDVRQAIEAVKARYRIDPDSVHLGGVSMGGFGTFQIGSESPDLFATAMANSGGGYWCQLEQMRNVPTFIHHGLADKTVPAFCSISTASAMQALGCQVLLYPYPELGHRPLPTEMTTPGRSLLDIARENEPATVVLRGRVLCFTHAYWAAIERFADPQEPGRVEAAFEGPNLLAVTSTNVKWLRLALPCKWIDPAKPMRVAWRDGRSWTDITAGDARAIYLRLDGERIEATTQRPAELDDQTAYTGGGAMRMLCEGRPVRLVYGSGGGDEAARKAEAFARSLARTPFVDQDEFQCGGWPVLKDTQVTDEVLRTCDLILLGSPADNAVLARMADQLPVKVADGQVTVQANVPMQYRQDQVAFSLAWRNPLAKDRLIWWLSGFDDNDVVRRTIDAGKTDLVVCRRDGVELAAARVVGDWQLEQPAPPTPARTLWPTYAVYSQALAASLRTSLDADVAIWPNWDPREDFGNRTLGWLMATRHDVYLVRMSGKDLREMHRQRLQRLTPATAAASGPSSQPASGPSTQPSPQEMADTQGGWAGVAADEIREDQTYLVAVVDDTVWDLPNGGANVRLARYISDEESEAALKRFYSGAAARQYRMSFAWQGDPNCRGRSAVYSEGPASPIPRQGPCGGCL